MLRVISIILLSVVLVACGAPGAASPSPSPPDSAAEQVLPGRAPDIEGQITQIDGSRVLVEAQPGADSGRKIWFTVDDSTTIVARRNRDLYDSALEDLAVGQRVEAWASGPMAESYPEQGTAEAILILNEAAASAEPSDPADVLPDRDPDVTGQITQQEGGRVLIEAQPGVMEGDKFWLTVDDSTPIFADVNGQLESRNLNDLRTGIRVSAWADGPVAMSYPAQGGAAAIVILDQGATEATPETGDGGLPTQEPHITGAITALDDRMLVEVFPGAMIGDKIHFTVNDATMILRRNGDVLEPAAMGDLEMGQRVEVWSTGAIATSYPGQGTAATIVIDERDDSPDAAGLPDREPEISGTITQTGNTIWINQRIVVFVDHTTRFLRRAGDAVEAIEARDIQQGQQVEVWTDAIRGGEGGTTPQAKAQVLLVIAD